MSSDFLNIVTMYKTNTELFKKAIHGIPPDRWFIRPGNDSNHLMWIAGHLVTSRLMALKMLGQEWLVSWDGLFARGAKLVDPEQYPGTEEIVRAWEDVSEKLSVSLSSMSAEVLAQPVSDGLGLPEFDGKISGRIALLALHETYHVGQMGFLRKWLGYGQAVG